MNFFLKIGLILFAFLYLVSPVDIIPDMLLPFIGWIDDGVILGTIFYLVRYGKLPPFSFGKKTGFSRPYNQTAQDSASSGKNTSSKPVLTPYEVLGISPNATEDQILTAYKQAVKKYHPDKVAHLGEEFSSLANKKFIEIQTAYDILKKQK